MTYSSCTGGKFRPEAESASSSLSSCPDWPGLGLELREAIWRIFLVYFFFCFFKLHSKMGFWTSFDYILSAQFVLSFVDWSIHFGSAQGALKSGFTPWVALISTVFTNICTQVSLFTGLKSKLLTWIVGLWQNFIGFLFSPSFGRSKMEAN